MVSAYFLAFNPMVSKYTYRFQTRKVAANDAVFLNWGYEEDPPMALPLAESDESNRYFIQLYHRAATQADLSGKRVLEVGCGHGGGASYLMRTLHPASYTGLDMNRASIAFCRERHNLLGVEFVQGDAEMLPFPDHSFDAVINVESSGAYRDFSRFLAEVARVLRLGGHFLYADLRPRSSIAEWEEALASAPMRMLSHEVINAQVLRGLEENTQRLLDLMDHLPTFLHRGGLKLAGVKGTGFYRAMQRGKYSYRMYCFTTIEASGPGGIAPCRDHQHVAASHGHGGCRRLSTWTMTREAITKGVGSSDGFLDRCRGSDITRFRCAGRRFVSISHPSYADHVLHEARLKYVKSNEYEPIRAVTGTNLLTDEGESWAAHRGVLNPTFARRHLNGIVDLMIDPITDVTDALATGARFDMHQTMVETTLQVVANSLFSQDFGPLVQSMNALATRGMRHGERLQRFGLWGLMPRAAYSALHWLAFSGLCLPPPLRDMQNFTLTIDRAVNAVIDKRLAHPTDSADLLNVLLRADGGTWPRQRIRDEALTFMFAGHETTANAMSWFWYLMALHADARDRMLAEMDDVLGARRPTAGDLDRLPWTTACLQEAQRLFPLGVLGRRAIEDDVIGGHRIRRGTTVLIPIDHIHHDLRWWPDPETFDASRFLQEAKDRPRSAYLPFGGGRRICIGQSFALMEMVLIAAIMSQRFAFDLAAGHRVEFEMTFTVRAKYGVHLIATSRS